jgi:uncharacterized membrane protein YhfC
MYVFREGESIMSGLTLTLNFSAMAALVTTGCAFQSFLAREQAWQWRIALIGSATFVIAARVLEPLALQIAGLTPLIAEPEYFVWWLLPALAAAAALFEEFGRLAGLWASGRHADWCPHVWSFAAGYAFAELLLIGLIGHSQLLWLAYAGDGAANLLLGLSPEARIAIERSLDDLGPATALWLLTERLTACAFQIALTLLVASAIKTRSVGRFGIALALHFAIDLPAAAYQMGAMPLWLVEAVYLVAGLWVLRWVRYCWQATGTAAIKRTPLTTPAAK